MEIDPRYNDLGFFEKRLQEIEKLIIEYNRTLLIGNRVKIDLFEDEIRHLFDMGRDDSIQYKLKSIKGNLQWNIVRLKPGYKEND